MGKRNGGQSLKTQVAKTGGPEVWMEWTVLCFGDGQEVEGGVVTEGNLLRMERISGA